MIVVSMPGDFAADALLSDVLRHVGRLRGTSRSVENVLREAAAERARGTCPVAVDRMLYGVLAGLPQGVLQDTAVEWWAHYRQHHDPPLPDPGRASRTPVVIVSDAPESVLRAVAADFRDAHVLGGTPVVDGCGLLTGANATPMAGPGGLGRLQRFLASLDVEVAGTPTAVDRTDRLLSAA